MPADGHPAARIVHYQALGINCLIVRNGDVYWAAFNDGFTEEINPITGKPRPVPDPAQRTKGYKVPDAYTKEYGYVPQVFSGTMRQAVASYYGRGSEQPFRTSWPIPADPDRYPVVHGIFSAPVMIEGKIVAKYWVIEISGDGVFSAPITSGTWSVRQFLQDPSATFPILNLSWAYINKPGTGVVQLLDASVVATVLNAGAALSMTTNGWAFNYSGTEAQIIVYKMITSPDRHLKFSRFKLKFSLIGSAWPNVQPSADLETVESDKIAYFWHHCLLWHRWTRAPGFTEGRHTWAASSNYEQWNWDTSWHSHHPTILWPSQDVPVFVCYDGDEEVLIRWKVQRTDEGEPVHGTTQKTNMKRGFSCSDKFNHFDDFIVWRYVHTITDFPYKNEKFSASSLVLFWDRESYMAVAVSFVYDAFARPPTGTVYPTAGKAVLSMTGSDLITESFPCHINYLPGYGGDGTHYPPVEPIWNSEIDKQDLMNFFGNVSDVESHVEAIHGSLYYPDSKLKPPDQKTNAIYRLSGAVITVGGFQKPPGSVPMGFAGKA